MLKQLILCALCVFATTQALDYKQVLSDGLKNAETILTKGKEAQKQVGSSDFECILCGIVVNELEGFVAENISETEIEALLTKDVCDHLSGVVKDTCINLAQLAPEIIDRIDNKENAATICVDKDFCQKPFTELPDPYPVPVYQINLDLPAEERWTEICSNTTYKEVMGTLISALEHLFDNSTIVSDLGKALNLLYFPSDLAAEIRGCAIAMDVDFGWLTFVNLGYEVTDACTSIVGNTADGKVIHVRNMDFWDGIWLTDHLKNLTMTVEYQKGGNTEFYATTFAGYVGVLSGMRPGGWSVSIDTRYYPKGGIGQLFYEIIAAIEEKNSSLVSFLTRKVLTEETTYAAAVENLSNDALIADVYYIVAGVNTNEGTVISRNRLNASDVWTLDQDGSRWFEVQTNYDHWTNPPWFDDRVKPANAAMNAVGQENWSLETALEVLSVKPVLNLQSTFTMLALPADSSYTSLMRNCPYPCAE